MRSLQYLFAEHDLEIIYAKRIPTHGGSIRVYAARKGKFKIDDSVNALLATEVENDKLADKLADFSHQVMLSKVQLHSLLCEIRQRKERVFGIGAPSRASTLINYVRVMHLGRRYII